MKILKLISFILFFLNFSLSATSCSDGSWYYKLPDEIGNLFKTKEKKDHQYGRAGQLLKDEKYSYSYDEVGNLTEKASINETWRYKWTQGGMLKKVIRPDGKHVDFTYDALGRRLTKTFKDQTTHFVWDRDVPLHEWTSAIDESNSVINEKGEKEFKTPENLTTWIFEDGTFIPMAKMQGEKSYSIITDHLGTPTEAYDEEGKKVWSRQLNIYGETRKELGTENFIPFAYAGQYQDIETGLSYNRFRYYSPESGTYISQDPIGLNSGEPNFYAYVIDVNSWIDPLGLNASPETAQAWEHRFNNLPPGEKFNAAQGKLDKVATKNGWALDSRLTKMNGRKVYTDGSGKLFAADTQHGRFEYHDKKGKHLGEFNIDGGKTKPAGTHKLRCG